MYQHNNRQLEIEAFKTPFRTPLDTENRWVKLAKLVPWDFVEEVYLRQQCYEDERIRNAVDGNIGEGKRRYSTDRVMTKLRETSETVISMVYLVMNLERLLREGASSRLLCILLRLKACLLPDNHWVEMARPSPPVRG